MAWLGGMVRALDVLGALVVAASLAWTAAAWGRSAGRRAATHLFVDGILGGLALEAAACSLRFVLHRDWLQLALAAALLLVRVFLARALRDSDSSEVGDAERDRGHHPMDAKPRRPDASLATEPTTLLRAPRLPGSL